MSDVLSEIDARIREVMQLRQTLESLAQGGNDPLVNAGINEATRMLNKLQSKKDLLEEANKRVSALVGTK